MSSPKERAEAATSAQSKTYYSFNYTPLQLYIKQPFFPCVLA